MLEDIALKEHSSFEPLVTVYEGYGLALQRLRVCSHEVMLCVQPNA